MLTIERMKPKLPKLPKRENVDPDLIVTSTKLTRKTSKLLMVLATWGNYGSVAEYCTATLDGILEERMAKMAKEFAHDER